MNKYKLELLPGHFPLRRADSSGRFSDVSPRDLPIPESMINAIFNWAGRFRDAMSWPDTASRGFKTDEAFAAFVHEGEELAQSLAAALGNDSIVETTVGTQRYVRMTSPRVERYRIFPDWGCDSPVWNGVPGSDPYQIPLELLPISDELVRGLQQWNDKFQKTLNWQDPRDSGFPTLAESQEFRREGEGLAERFQIEVGHDSRVSLEYKATVYVRPQ